jgi:hypothetical protein
MPPSEVRQKCKPWLTKLNDRVKNVSTNSATTAPTELLPPVAQVYGIGLPY